MKTSQHRTRASAHTRTASLTSTTDATVPTPIKRTPLPAIEGPIAPPPVPMDPEEASDRAGLRNEHGPTSLAIALVEGLAWDRNDDARPIDLALGTLRQVADELLTLQAAAGAEEMNDELVGRVTFSLARRAEMVIDICERMQRAEAAPRRVIAPLSHDVAAALLTLPGVLSAPTTWERLLRIADRLGVVVDTNEPLPGLFVGREGFFCALPSVVDGVREPLIGIRPNVADREATLAEMLGHAVARREGYGQVSDEWCDELAAMLLDRVPVAQKGAA